MKHHLPATPPLLRADETEIWVHAQTTLLVLPECVAAQDLILLCKRISQARLALQEP